ncbi:hypothetical protein J3459_015362 [Metarhizium acridum]|nr:hypothetical protein J3459_015362 [Metarhizium acridum]
MEVHRGRENVVVRRDGSDFLAVGGSAYVEESMIVIVADRDGAGDALFNNPRNGDGPGLFSPAAGPDDGCANNLGTMLQSFIKGGNENVIAG